MKIEAKYDTGWGTTILKSGRYTDLVNIPVIGSSSSPLKGLVKPFSAVAAQTGVSLVEEVL